MERRGFVLTARVVVWCLVVTIFNCVSYAQEKPARIEYNLQEQPVSFFLSVEPASFLFSPDVDGFSATDGGLLVIIDGTGSYTPSAKAGIGIKLGDLATLDLAGGAGYLWNEAFDGSFGLVDASVNFRLGNRFTVGPHLGFLFFDDMEMSDAGVTFEGTTGTMLGVKSEFFATKNLALSLSVDYLDASCDVQPDAGWTASDNTLDLSGLGLTFALSIKF